ncbi:restriction endonuclease subunit S [Aphanothece hegewaldii CCALA 016]|uniref:Restriction endonuclease subunit S n=1 Tax=Aphanothece hegewaldii CCALA 016 TaxID=2107694 RepID=A0A2T1LRH2_9CHRO|nr:restriction endonuclease subunit S [Aphanothece hegewaldii]PSF31307.1 restriction endonuclease subunit S [Aphanothece hegewaldii CCALA 016]
MRNDSQQWKQYPKYKNSGVEWLGMIPDGWNIFKLKRMAEINISNVDKKTELNQEKVLLCNYVDVYYNDYITNKLNFLEATATKEQKKRFELKKGDVLLTKDSETWDDIAIPACVETDLDNVLCGYHLAHIRPHPNKLYSKYLFRAISASGLKEQFWVAANGVTRFGLSKSSITNALFPLPPFSEQEKIAQFLDKETTKIDNLINKKQRLIELLQEKRTALISHAVTKGLNPDVPMKYSGVEWLGMIPESWVVSKAKLISSIFVPQRNKPDLNTVDGVRWITMENLISPSINLSLSGYFVSQSALLQAGSKVLPKECIIASCVGNFGIASVNLIPVVINQQLQAYIPNKQKIDIWFFRYFITSSKIYFELVATSTTLVYVNQTSFGELPTVLPPLAEQEKIAEYLDIQTQKIDNLINKTQTSIEYLKEYRTALISAAVTGKIDVREEV